MAINRNEYIHKIDTGLKANNDYKKFLYRFKVESKSFYKVFDYSNKNWDKRTRINKAKYESIEYKEKELNRDKIDDEDITLDKFSEKYFDTMDDSTSYSKNRWKDTIKSFYERYIKKDIGHKKVKNIRQMDIKSIILKLKQEDLSARTQKITLEVLNPIFKSAIANRIIVHNPCTGIMVKRPKTKKKVQNASIELKQIYDAIKKVFKDDMFFQALYLFALQGRRKSEIITLRWEDIDFDRNMYTLRNTKNGEEQTFILPDSIAILLLALKSNKQHYVFESPLDETKHIQNIQIYTNKLKKELKNPKFGIHYLRNVVVSAMAEQGINATYLSGALGHSDLNTIRKYLSMPYKKGSEMANETIKLITENVEDNSTTNSQTNQE